MNTELRHQLIEQIHESGRQVALMITGGGSGAIAALLEVPGGAGMLLEAVVPYSRLALEDRLGGAVDQAASEATARAMAMVSFLRARELGDHDCGPKAGIGATAGLVTSQPKRGPHQIHVAWQDADRTVVLSRELAKGRRTRIEEEQVAADLILSAIGEACGIGANQFAVSDDEPISRRQAMATSQWRDLLLGVRPCVTYGQDETPGVIFPGAFNPIHEGHRRMAALASQKLGRPVALEISITNVDKPPLDYLEIEQRLAALAGRDVVLTRAATFVEKARLFPGCTFIVGIDTIERIGQVRFYGGDTGRRDAAIEELARLGCRFLVFGRALEGRFGTLEDVDTPPTVRTLCEQVPQREFREDVSSSELRAED